jgi:hypothetical protein
MVAPLKAFSARFIGQEGSKCLIMVCWLIMNTAPAATLVKLPANRSIIELQGR